jgi:beta-aspartyl-peptidase (threonine type)
MSQQKFSPVLLVHGGAWAIPDDMVEAHLGGVRAAIAAGWKLLAEGKSALAAVEAAVVAMEDDETFDAGRGSFLTSDGGVQLDALMMDGNTLRAGGVGCVEHIRNPIRLAHKVLTESPHVYLVAEGAERFATEHRIPLCDNSELIIPREVERLRRFKAAGKPDSTFAGAALEVSGTGSHDTVGAVAVDADGNLAAATSTGGTLNKTPGRVGDSSLIGCGCYADNAKAAVSCTGWGEPIMKLVLGKWACDRVEEGQAPHVVAQRAIQYLKDRVNGHGGMILLDRKGRIGAFHNTPRMAWGVKDAKREHVQVEGTFQHF